MLKQHNKQHDTRAVTLKRMAVEHRAYKRSHLFDVKESEATPEYKAQLKAVAQMHLETARILDAEAEKIRGMR